MFLEVENYDLTVDTRTDVHWMVWPRTLRRNRRSPSNLWLTAATAKDAHYAFEVSLMQWDSSLRQAMQCSRLNDLFAHDKNGIIPKRKTSGLEKFI